MSTEPRPAVGLAFCVRVGRMRRTLGTMLIVGLLAGCGGDDDGGDMDDNALPTCEALFAPGQATDDLVELADGGVQCMDGVDGLRLEVLLSFECGDRDATVHYNNYGWGISGETWQAHEPGRSAPSADVC